MNVQQFARDARVLTGDDVSAGQKIQGPQSDIPCVSNGRGDNIEARVEVMGLGVPTFAYAIVLGRCVNAIWRG